MPKYVVYFQSVAETRVEVDVDDPDDAIDTAWDRVGGSLCHQCAHAVDLSGEWDPVEVADAAGKTVWRNKE